MRNTSIALPIMPPILRTATALNSPIPWHPPTTIIQKYIWGNRSPPSTQDSLDLDQMWQRRIQRTGGGNKTVW
ncbi:hypothetical protein HOY80DRAFT_994686 [Tuber brumale]|nr:hypothetical protein HOY80DRAFT_994686 [Tuber brumale]